jgi:hypothetical protein
VHPGEPGRVVGLGGANDEGHATMMPLDRDSDLTT